jgi:Phage tail lysozyme
MSLPSNAMLIWETLLQYGATPIQAAGIMGNMMQESGMNPESSAVDTNGYVSQGLVSWNAASYPQAGSLLTGNPQADIISQIQFLAQTGGFSAASGTTASQAASNFMNNYEHCDPKACNEPNRVGTAEEVYAAALSNNWANPPGNYALTSLSPSIAGGASSSGAGPSATTDAGCAINIGVVGCIWKNSWSHGLVGSFALVAGAVVMSFGVLLVVGLPTQKLRQTVTSPFSSAKQGVEERPEELIIAQENERMRRRAIAQAHRNTVLPPETIEARAVRRENERQQGRRAVADFRRSQMGPKRNPAGVGNPKPAIPKIPVE